MPSGYPSFVPTLYPSQNPSIMPTPYPSITPTFAPSTYPTLDPSCTPSIQPTTDPTIFPTLSPSTTPSLLPTQSPTSQGQTITPTYFPSFSRKNNGDDNNGRTDDYFYIAPNDQNPTAAPTNKHHSFLPENISFSVSMKTTMILKLMVAAGIASMLTFFVIQRCFGSIQSYSERRTNYAPLGLDQSSEHNPSRHGMFDPYNGYNNQFHQDYSNHNRFVEMRPYNQGSYPPQYH